MRCLVLGIAVAVSSLVPVVGNADDQRIADFIKQRLQSEQQAGNLKGFNVDMRVEDGTVWFEGHVSRASQEMTILRTAQAAGHLGVVKVIDDIEVRQSGQSGQSGQTSQTSQKRPYKNVGYNRPVGAYRAPTPVAQPAPAAAVQPASVAVAQPAPAAAVPTAPAFQGSGSRVEPLAGTAARSIEGVPYGVPAPAPAPAPATDLGYASGGPVAFAPASSCSGCVSGGFETAGPPVGVPVGGAPLAAAPQQFGPGGGGLEAPNLPGYAWPSYSAHPNYGALAYPQQYSAAAWPYIGPFYPYPQVPLGWRKVSLEWDDGWWFLDFHDK